MTKQRKVILILVILLTVCLGGFLVYQSRFAEVGENRYDKNIESIDLSGAPVGDLTQLQPFVNLKRIDLRNSGLTCRQYDELKVQFPGAEILWDIPFQGGYLDMDTQELVLESLSQEDMARIPYFTRLKRISAENCPDYANLHALRQQYPDLDFSYQVPLGGEYYSYDVTELTIPGGDVEEMMEVLSCFTQLKNVELQEPLAPIEEILKLRKAFPEVNFSWHLELGGTAVDEFTETLNLTGIPMTVEEMDAVLPYLLNLTYVDMTDCGISNEEMEALNNRYEDIKIVWTVQIGWLRCKTDITTFMPVRDGMYAVSNSDLTNLRYCHDVVALDIGHMKVSDISFLAYMPHMKYLILAETDVRDLTPLTGLTELVYLELFLTEVVDWDVLLTLTALEDLNVSYTCCDAEVLAQMTWLKNLWWSCPTAPGWKSLPDALPDTRLVFFTKSSTGKGWRQLPNYYAQRDAFGMHYMTG